MSIEKWLDFSSKVISYSGCDGSAAIHTSSVSESSGPGLLEHGWLNDPPHLYLELKEDGSEQDLIKEAQKELEDLTNMSEDQFKEVASSKDTSWDDSVVYIVECRAGIVSDNAELKVRNWFWTRIVSSNLNLAIEKTIETWVNESLKSPALKALENKERNIDYINKIMTRMRNNNSIDPLTVSLSFYKDKEEFFSAFKPRQVWWVAKFINELELEISKLKQDFKALNDPELQEYITAYNERRKIRYQDKNTFESEESFEFIREEGRILMEFLSNWSLNKNV